MMRKNLAKISVGLLVALSLFSFLGCGGSNLEFDVAEMAAKIEIGMPIDDVVALFGREPDFQLHDRKTWFNNGSASVTGDSGYRVVAIFNPTTRLVTSVLA